jgi:hypothetical protein
MLANPEVIEALRLARQAMSQLDEAAQGKGIDLDLGEIYEALETYLGDDLLTLEDAASGRPLWDGNSKNLQVRRATDEEAERWKHSLLAAMQSGEQEPGDMDWVAFLVPVRDPRR